MLPAARVCDEGLEWSGKFVIYSRSNTVLNKCVLGLWEDRRWFGWYRRQEPVVRGVSSLRAPSKHFLIKPKRMVTGKGTHHPQKKDHLFSFQFISPSVPFGMKVSKSRRCRSGIQSPIYCFVAPLALPGPLLAASAALSSRGPLGLDSRFLRVSLLWSLLSSALPATP
jgi:hypothetical protein